MITQYPNSTVTNIVTNVYTTNASFYTPVELDINPIADFLNAAPGPHQSATQLNGTAIITAGVTM